MRVAITMVITSLFVFVACAEKRDTKPRLRSKSGNSKPAKGDKTTTTEIVTKFYASYRFDSDCDTGRQEVEASNKDELNYKLCVILEDEELNKNCSQEKRNEYKNELCSTTEPGDEGSAVVTDEVNLEFLSEEFSSGKYLLKIESVTPEIDDNGNDSFKVSAKQPGQENMSNAAQISADDLSRLADHFNLDSPEAFIGKHLRSDKNLIADIINQLVSNLNADSNETSNDDQTNLGDAAGTTLTE